MVFPLFHGACVAVDTTLVPQLRRIGGCILVREPCYRRCQELAGDSGRAKQFPRLRGEEESCKLIGQRVTAEARREPAGMRSQVRQAWGEGGTTTISLARRGLEGSVRSSPSLRWPCAASGTLGEVGLQWFFLGLFSVWGGVGFWVAWGSVDTLFAGCGRELTFSRGRWVLFWNLIKRQQQLLGMIHICLWDKSGMSKWRVEISRGDIGHLQ